jgi:hypothetical protein
MIFKLLNWQGIAGIAAGVALSVLLLIQKGETSHWKKQSASFEQLYHSEQAAFATTITDTRAAADEAQAADRANAQRVAADQAAINQRTKDEFENRLAAARAAGQRLRLESEAAADPGARGSASMPSLSASAGGVAQAAVEDELSVDEREVATEQAIQLDELIKWIRQQHAVDPNGETKTP